MVNPIVRRVSKNYMLTSLQQMEQAVRSAESPNRTGKPSVVGAVKEGFKAKTAHIRCYAAVRELKPSFDRLFCPEQPA
jgi:hypothetical protein